jgi:hypothetical protein
MKATIWLCAWLAAFGLAACGDDSSNGGGSGADAIGVGAECNGNTDCESGQTCLSFSGGYCGLDDCTGDDDCPTTSACIAHTDGSNYCFRTCVDKIDCNRNRSVDNESNCSSNVEFVDGKNGSKACVPPS